MIIVEFMRFYRSRDRSELGDFLDNLGELFEDEIFEMTCEWNTSWVFGMMASI